jgi:2-succinyl-6-hydroxy-2,4-cyclohexadiene-1-carboxylate synthase
MLSVLALHGFTGRGSDFQILSKKLPPGWIWQTPDLPGHGDALGAVSVAAAVESFRSLLLQNDTGCPRVLMGYSMGARLALALALSCPAVFSALILIGAHPGLSDPAEKKVRRERDQALAARIRSETLESFLSFWQNQPLIQSQQHIPESERLELFASRQAHRTEALADALDVFGPGVFPEVPFALESLAMPVLWLTGDRDVLYGQIATDAVVRCPEGSQHHVIRGVGHAAHLEGPAECALAINAFLASLK